MGDSPARQDARNAASILEEFSEYLDIPMHVTLEVGRRNMKVREILQLKTASVVEVPKSAGENVDIFVNGKLVAYGEIIEMDSQTGVRLTDIFVQN